MEHLGVPGAGAPDASADYYKGKAAAMPRSRSGNKPFQKEMTTRHQLTKARMQMVFVMVGLPARGKSFISRRLESFLSWKGHTTKVFNVGKYRREAVEVEQSGKSDFFDPNNTAAKAQREAVALAALKDMLEWFGKDGEIGIFDATNSTEERRQLIINTCRNSGRELGIVFIETLCTNTDVLEENMRCKVAGSPDFASMTEEQALQDLRDRIAKYEAVYETIPEEAEYSYIKTFNMSSRVLVSGVYGPVAQSVLPYLMAIHIGPRPVWLVRAGEGVGLRTSKTHSSIGSPLAQLTDDGKAFSEVMSDYVRDQIHAFEKIDAEPAADIARRYSHGPHEFGAGRAPISDVLEDHEEHDEPHDGLRVSRQLHRSRSQSHVSADQSHDDDDGECSAQGGAHGDVERRSSLATLRSSVVGERADATSLRRSRRLTKKWQDSVVRAANGVVDARAKLKVLCSTLPRANATVERLRTPCSRENYFTLTPLDKGSHMGLALDEIAATDPKWFERFSADHLHTRFPGGECYHDLMNRLEGVLVEIEQQTMPVLVVSHVSVLQVLLCYFRNIPVSEAPRIEVPLHTVIEMQPTVGGPWVETRTELVPPPQNGLPGPFSDATNELEKQSDLAVANSSLALPDGAFGMRKSSLVSSTELSDLLRISNSPMRAGEQAKVLGRDGTSPQRIRHPGLG
jgi:broad specificity phosphatase PhoE/predicted kinase